MKPLHITLSKQNKNMQLLKDDENRTQSVHKGDFYMTGDKAVRDDEGYFWFVGRADDIILTSG